MNEQNRPVILGATMLVLLALIAGWSTVRMLGLREDAHRRASDLAQFQQLAADIEALRDNDEVKQLGGDSAAQEQLIAERVAQAGKDLGLSGPWWEDTIHKNPRRVGNTAYLRKPAVLYTSGLTLNQITTLLHELTYDSPLTAQELTLRTPPGEDPGDRWDADITLTYLIFEPQGSD